MVKFEGQIIEYIREYSMLRPGDAVVVGVSGGADSVALLRVLVSIRDNCPEYQELAIKVISDRFHMPMLFTAQQIAGPPDLQVAHGDSDAAAKFRILTDGSKAFLRHLAEHPVSAVHQESIGRPAGPSDPAAQLI